MTACDLWAQGSPPPSHRSLARQRLECWRGRPLKLTTPEEPREALATELVVIRRRWFSYLIIACGQWG
jgi:hypothetical protein